MDMHLLVGDDAEARAALAARAASESDTATLESMIILHRIVSSLNQNPGFMSMILDNLLSLSPR
jgi:hypothetical protein